ncbi:MAG: cytochrome P450 [Gaiellales bacterium]
MSAAEAVDLVTPERWEERIPHDDFAVLRRESPVHWHEESAPNHGFWAITRHEDVVFVSKNPKVFSSGMGLTMLEEVEPDSIEKRRSLIDSDAPLHNHLRRVVSPLFTPKAIAEHEAFARATAGRLLDAAVPRGSFDWVLDVAEPLPITVLLNILGVPSEDADQMITLSNQMIAIDDPDYAPDYDSLPPGVDPKDLPFGSPASYHVFEYGRRIGEERRASPTDDLVSRLIHSEVDGDSLTELEYCNMFQILILAGNETTRTTLTHGMKAFIDNPDQWELLRERPELMDGAVEEIIRWATPVLYMRRTATEDTELRGQRIAAGDKVVMWYMSANYDEDVFDDPHRFDITRDPNPHLGFGGGGPHFCLGAWLARLQIRIMFEECLARGLRLESDGEARRVRSNFVNGVKSMPVRVAG